MKFEIKARTYLGGKVLFAAEIPDDTEPQFQVRTALEIAVKARANLAGADLAGANLARANLAGANLARANLAGAYLADAYLARANLAGADLAGADLARANLADAYLARANLADAYLAGANLARANLADADLARAYLADAYLARANLADAYLARAYLADAYLARANLAGADLARANLADAVTKPASPEEIMRLDEIRKIVLEKPARLRMNGWHSTGWTPEHTPEEEHKCGSAHCIAGWLQALSDDPSVRQMPAEVAGKLLCPTFSFMFYTSAAAALQWLKDRGYARGTEKEAA